MSSPPQGDGPEKKITRLAIGVEGGFDADSSRKKFEFVDKYSIIVLPGFVTIPWPDSNFPELVKASVNGVLEAQSASKVAELEALAGEYFFFVNYLIFIKLLLSRVHAPLFTFLLAQ